MKKILIMLFMCLFCGLQAQDNTRIISNTMADGYWFGINGGAVVSQKNISNYKTSYHPEFGIEIGKWLTPVIGLSLSDEVEINSMEIKTAIDANQLSADLHISLINWIGGFSDKRLFDIEVIPSFLWQHYSTIMWNTNHENFLGGKGSLRFITNLGYKAQWQLYIQPGVAYIDRPHLNHGFFDACVGINYRFKGKKSNSHTFAIDADRIPYGNYDEVVAENAYLKNKPAEVREVTKVIEVSKNAQNLFFVTFALNNWELSEEDINILNSIPKGSVVTIEGYASPDGNELKNNDLSQRRANAVKYYLEKHNITVNSAEGKGCTHHYYSNRIAVITLVK